MGSVRIRTLVSKDIVLKKSVHYLTKNQEICSFGAREKNH